MLIAKTETGDLSTTTYGKPTNTGLLTNFISFTAFSYKTELIKTLVDRVFKINSSSLDLRKLDFSFVTRVLQKIRFPKFLVNQVIDSYNGSDEPSDGSNKEPRYYKIPFVLLYYC